MALAHVTQQPFPKLSYAAIGKRAFDVALVLLSLPFVIPVIALMALLVALDGHSPFYTQARVGRHGRQFRMLKIRTMVHNADAMLAKCLEQDAALRAEWDATQKLKKDMRITRIGRILRKTSLDELPQLFNVLTGSMSLVGPRPMMPSQEELYPGRSYYRLRPGITGFWQISDRNHCDFRDRSKYDAVYERELSLVTDLAVMWRTFSVVLRGTGY
ncbi:sugar transferase [Poseidonocella sedimentorum]|nr:sugar transferase [Poseidonocella sedimentorum]